jgi:hypothetical protein
MPLVPLLPLFGIECNFLLACSMDLTSWLLWLGFVVIGLVIYFSYSINNSKLEDENVFRGLVETSMVSENERIRTM